MPRNEPSSSDREGFEQFSSFCVLTVALVVAMGLFAKIRGAEMPVPRFGEPMPTPKFTPTLPAPQVKVVTTPVVVVAVPKGLTSAFRTTPGMIVPNAVVPNTLSVGTSGTATRILAAPVRRSGGTSCST